MHDLAKKCQENEKATDADYELAISHEVPTTETGNCLQACLMEEHGVVWSYSYLIFNSAQLKDVDDFINVFKFKLKGLTIDLEALDALIRKKTEDTKFIEASSEVAAECATIAAEDNR